jgi:hypothetical protein
LGEKVNGSILHARTVTGPSGALTVLLSPTRRPSSSGKTAGLRELNTNCFARTIMFHKEGKKY